MRRKWLMFGALVPVALGGVCWKRVQETRPPEPPAVVRLTNAQYAAKFPKGVYNGFAQAGQLTVFSLDPRRSWQLDKPNQAATFHDYKIIGQTTVRDTQTVEQLRSALRDSLSGTGMMFQCFQPRHGLRFEQNNKTTDFLICFTCRQLYVYKGANSQEKQEPTVFVQGRKQEVENFNQVLASAGIELAPL